MSIKADRPQVRTAEQLERKYNFATIEKNVKMNNEGLYKVSNELFNFVRAVAGDTATLEKQLDGTIETWYGNGTPTLSNEPAVDWDTSDERAAHVEDLYYDRETGSTYVFTENSGTYSWEETNRNFLAEILALANNAKETADGKKVVFTSDEPPTPPYDIGDLWLYNKELYVCQFARIEGDTYHDNDFILATNYVDGAYVQNFADDFKQIVVNESLERMTTANQDLWTFKSTTEDVITQNKLDEVNKYIDFNGGNILLYATDSVYKLQIENNRIAIYRKENDIWKDISSWEENVFNISQININNRQTTSVFSFIPRPNGSLSFRKIK